MSATGDTFVGVVGAGSWGTALAVLLARRGAAVRLWGHEAGHVEAIRRDRENRLYLPGVPIPETVVPTADLAALLNARFFLMVPPSKAMREVAGALAAMGPRPGAAVISCTKGIEFETGLRMTEVLAELLPGRPVAALSGPSHAEEVGRGSPTAVVIGCEDAAVALELQAAFSGPNFRAYTSGDVAGIELGGALKNVYAIAAGIGDGLGLGDNSKAALVTRSLAELIRLGAALGGQRETFQGLSGIGDLMVTCFSKHSRNRGVGERLGKGETLAAIRASMAMVAEGVPTARSAHRQARVHRIETPILNEVYRVLFEDVPAQEGMERLLGREPRPEADP